MNKLILFVLRWRLIRSQEKYVVWKARYEEGQRQLLLYSGYADNPWNRQQVIQAAGKTALYLERTESLLRVPGI